LIRGELLHELVDPRLRLPLTRTWSSWKGSTTIYDWIQKFVPMISAYANSLTPQLSDAWHADELFVHMKGGVGLRNMKNIAFLWNVMDRKTRFLLASRLSKSRDISGAERALTEAKANAGGYQPKIILTDALKAYGDGIGFAFRENTPKHEARMGAGKPHANNNCIERLNGTLRERVKVQ
jgi:transposase-like protein